METNNITIEPLKPERYLEASRVLARAFEHYALHDYILRDMPNRLEKLTWMFERWIYAVAPSVNAYITSSGEGVAVWLPPGHSSTPRLRDIIRTGLIWTPFKFSVRCLPRAIRVGLDVNRRIRERVLPCWELDTIGVDPAAQRTGVGGLLIRHGLEQPDRDRIPCYVITHNPANVAYYERFGFKLTEQRPEREGDFFACTLRRDTPTKNNG